MKRNSENRADERLGIAGAEAPLALARRHVLQQEEMQRREMALAILIRKRVSFERGMQHQPQELGIAAPVFDDVVDEGGDDAGVVASRGGLAQLADERIGARLGRLALEDRGVQVVL